MKKFFLFAIAALAAMTTYAENKVWDFSAENDTINTVAAITAKSDYSSNSLFELVDATSSDGKPYVKWNYNGAGDFATLNFKSFPMTVEYKNSGAKTEFVKSYASYFQVNRKGVKLTFHVAVGDTIALEIKEYSKQCEFNITGGNVENIVTPLNEEAVILVVATAADVVFDSNVADTSYGQACQFLGVSILCPAKTAVENVEAETKAMKVVENGQLLIIKNGVRYNALGAVVE